MLNEECYIFVKNDDLFMQDRATQELHQVKLPFKYEEIIFLERSPSKGVSCVVRVADKVQLLVVETAQPKPILVSEYSLPSSNIRLRKVDEINKRICLLVD